MYVVRILMSTLHNSTYVYTKHKISMIRLRTLLKYSIKNCVLALHASLFAFLFECLFSFDANATTTKTVNLDE